MPQPVATAASEEHAPLQLNLIPRLARKASTREMPAAIKAPPLTPVRVEPLRWSAASFSLSFLSNIDRLEINETVTRNGVTYYVVEVSQFHYNSRLPTNVNNPRMAVTRLSDTSEPREPDFRVERRYSDFAKLRHQVKLWTCPNAQFTCQYCYEYGRYMRFKLRQPRLLTSLTTNVEKRKDILQDFMIDFIDLAQNPSKNTVHRCEAHQHEEFARICSLDAFPVASPLSVSEETFSVIKHQLQHRKFRAELRQHRQEKTLRKYVARMGSGETMCRIARSADFSPCMLARLLLEAKYGWSKTTISNFFKEAMKDENQEDAAPNRRGLSEHEFARVMREIRECVTEDAYCSPLADRIRHNMGLEYEYLLLETLRNRQLVFESEDMLREKGLSKTPDVRLLLPIGVKDPTNGQLHVVNWIDSKAMFGDRHTHETENASQLSSDRDIFITDSFPEEISLPGAFDPLASVTKLKEGAEVKLQPAKMHTDFDDDYNPITTCEL
uniref:CDAN1-interacting nuclease 1 n=1 Tax=Phytophthora ramorum TaxID=164328 RepID=H3GQ24_PHYRM